ncbi:MAG: discoidin domain-containing protein, partial [Chloroflexi bacterium]|nr:discoidin domain-containing protein [Chloroflexota bacterium]
MARCGGTLVRTQGGWTRAWTALAAASFLAGCTLQATPSPAPTVLEPSSPAPAPAAPAAVPAAVSLARYKTATASASLPDQPASSALDGDPETAWGAGTHSTQWIEVDLGTAF